MSRFNSRPTVEEQAMVREQAWYSAGLVGNGTLHEQLVRSWEPGDGIRCSSAGKARNYACSEPVAVVKKVYTEGAFGGKNFCTSTTRVLCVRHLATLFDADLGSAADRDVEKAAAEAVVKAHWDEYVEELTASRDRLMDERLSMLPTDLRDLVKARLAAAEEAVAS